MYTIRTATKADASALGYLHYTCWCETYAGQLDPGYLSKGSAEKSAAIFLRNGCRDMFLAEEDGSPIGFCGYSISRDNDAAPTCGEIDGIYLLQRCQGYGMGTRLMDEACQALRSRGCTEVTLWVLATNTKAIGFYEHRGFQANGSEQMVPYGQPVRLKRYRAVL